MKQKNLPSAVAIAVGVVLLAWTAWSLNQSDWAREGGTDGILKFWIALRLGIAIFLLAALYLSAKSTFSKFQKRVPRLYLPSWNRRQLAILSPLVFLFAYLGTLILIPLLSKTIEIQVPPWNDVARFWHETGAMGLSLMTMILAINTLAAVYLWLSFRSNRSSVARAGVVLYLPYAVGLLFLLAVTVQYYQISQLSPELSLLRYPSGNLTP